jgi:Tol biopolymer transport system component
MRVRAGMLLASLLACDAACGAGREAVLRQVDLPHNYYFREMYLPQLTSGPQYPVFSPDGTEVVYSMAGSLWRQRIGSGEAREITHGEGYDYQPDWSPDGKRIVFARYAKDAVELWQLELASGRTGALTDNHGVNLEPRYSPDGRRIAFVSTDGSGHFELKVADLDGPALGAATTLIGGRKSEVPRYYYSAFDHAISPSWTPDGKRIVFVSNREVAYGTGGLWSVSVADPGDLEFIHGEETTWRASPDVAADGRRILYSSYHGRQWHQLWLTTIEGAAPLPLTFGERDVVQARWSRDGERIAYVSNEFGDTALWVQDVAGGARTRVLAQTRHTLAPRYRLPLRIIEAYPDDAPMGPTMPARVSIVGSDGRAYAPDGAWLHADDGFDRSLQGRETGYFHCSGTCYVELPKGKAKITVWHGLDFQPSTLEFDGADGLNLSLFPITLPEWAPKRVAADLHVHMNYGGHYRNDPERLAEQGAAEGLDAIYNLVVNKEERIPDIAVFGQAPKRYGRTWVLQGQEFHSSYWGHLGLLDLGDHFLTPDFSAYRGTAFASAWPDNGEVARLAHAQGALVGYAHPFDLPVDPDTDASLSNEFPADVAHGRVDYYELAGFSDHRASADIWYRLLNLGYRIPAGAGSDTMANYASLRGPVGIVRTLLDVGGEATPAALHAALKAGRTTVSNSALLAFEIGGQAPGGVAKLAQPGKLAYRLALRSIVPMQHVELVQNGEVVATLAPGASVDAAGEVELKESGWLLLRAWNEGADPLVFDIYPYASTSPVYVEVGDAKPRSPADARYFIRWIERLIASAGAREDYNSTREKQRVLEYLQQAKSKFEAQQ